MSNKTAIYIILIFCLFVSFLALSKMTISGLLTGFLGILLGITVNMFFIYMNWIHKNFDDYL